MESSDSSLSSKVVVATAKGEGSLIWEQRKCGFELWRSETVLPSKMQGSLLSHLFSPSGQGPRTLEATSILVLMQQY